MANPQFSSQVVYPITEKPQTDPKEVAVYRDLFNVFNSFRILFGQLDQEFAKKLNDAPSDGKVYGRKDGDWVEVTGGGGGGGSGGALELLQHVTVGTATPNIVFSGLDFDTDEMYQIELIHLRNTGTDQVVKLFYNNDTTDANYRRYAAFMASAGRANGADIALMGTGSNSYATGTIQVRKTIGQVPIAFSTSAMQEAAGIQIYWYHQRWTSAINVNSLTLNNANSFGVGTIARLYRLNRPPLPPPPPDPYYSQVVSLLHFDSDFTDEKGHVWTPSSAGAQIDVGTFKYGTGSLSLNGTSWLSTPASADFGFEADDYTIEGWVRLDVAGGNRILFDNRAGALQGIGIYAAVSTGWGIYNNAAAIGVGAALPTGTWIHLAVSKIGTTVRGFAMGTLAFTGTDTRTLAASASAFIGATGGGIQGLQGKIDDLRITKGVGRYTTNFLPPPQPYPNY